LGKSPHPVNATVPGARVRQGSQSTPPDTDIKALLKFPLREDPESLQFSLYHFELPIV
jgi:hypothetical protein